jgi:hypothetical protein
MAHHTVVTRSRATYLIDLGVVVGTNWPIVVIKATTTPRIAGDIEREQMVTYG